MSPSEEILRWPTKRYHTAGEIGALTSQLTIDQTQLSVPDSAYLALQAVRLQQGVRIVWIDSVCVNQGDEAERGPQVAIMDRIYSLGTRNLIYLGKDDGHAESVVAALEELDAEIRRDTDNYINFLGFLKPNGRNYHTSWGRGRTSQKASWKDMVKMLSLPWFSRLWVVEEVALARSNVCWTTSDVDALTTAAYLFEAADRDYGMFHFTYVGQKVWRYTMVTMPILSEFKVTDQRDRIYGMLGLLRYCAGGNVRLAIQPDHAKSAAEALTGAMLVGIREIDALIPLEMVREGTKEMRLELQLSSWVPLWTSQDRYKDPVSLRSGFPRMIIELYG
ncbi:hypothetical protein AC579_6512 [Pseudocercospora musae]|uniref:Heterokaryon incompatibility domain-containing protein n=1 Tax=Pseudocercospora musae TaxID=113226 RepID=A0A139I3L3_9PEZI|nr:hypothetical protein AC579_6512 [Pseudocercospora musae]